MSENEIAKRAKGHLSTVLLTVMSIVQAIALELLWSHIQGEELLYVWSFESLLAWVQIATTLLGVVLIWLTYSGLVMRFRWVPSTGDSIMPFVVGLAEFGLIEVLGPKHLGIWFLVLALTFGLAQWIVQHAMRRARLDGDNDVFFSGFPAATKRDHLPSLLTIVALASLGLVLLATQNRGGFALLALGIAGIVLSYQLYLADHFWNRSVQAPGFS